VQEGATVLLDGKNIHHDERKKQMTVAITLNDGSKIYPSFDPEHKEAILSFYRNQADSLQIQNYFITDNKGNTVALGGKF
jgi:hypothetical protein